MMKLGYHWLNIIQDYLLPPTCLLCGHDGDGGIDLCRYCREQLPQNLCCCYRCGLAMATVTAAPTPCGRCLSLNPAFDVTHAPYLHQAGIRHLVTALKFSADYKNARLLGQLLARHLQQQTERPEYIIPVPLHPTRYRQRGFNQSLEIARTVSKQLQLPLDFSSCKRIKNTTQQTSLSAKQRRNNMKRAFAVVKPLKAKHVAILDDVMTTGSTMHELAQVLKNAGVEQVDVWVCARA